MHTLTFFPLGNADCCRVDLSGGQKLLFDYANMRCADDEEDLRIDLPNELREDLNAAKRDYYDVVAFSHLDNDHICGAPEFFYFEHAKKYQGEGRIKIRTLWVPAAVIIEEGCEDDAKIVQAEARYRLKEGKGIRVFSPPDSREWPTVYIRGVVGLRERVEDIQRRTATMLHYVGEWHSHPDGCSCRPSSDDKKAFAWLTNRMAVEAYPAIMLIEGTHERAWYLGKMI